MARNSPKLCKKGDRIMFEIGDTAYLDFGSNHYRTNEEVKVIDIIPGAEVEYYVEMVNPEQDWYGKYRVWRYTVHACQIKKNKVFKEELKK